MGLRHPVTDSPASLSNILIQRILLHNVHPKTLVEIAMVLSTNSVSFPSNSHVSATFSILLRLIQRILLHNVIRKFAYKFSCIIVLHILLHDSVFTSTHPTHRRLYIPIFSCTISYVFSVTNSPASSFRTFFCMLPYVDAYLYLHTLHIYAQAAVAQMSAVSVLQIPMQKNTFFAR